MMPALRTDPFRTDPPGTGPLSAAWAAAAFCLAMVLGAIWHLPATLMDALVSWQSQGSLRVAQAQGGFWSGQGVLVTQHGIRITGQMQWQVRPSVWPLGSTIRLEAEGLAWGGAQAQVSLGPQGIVLPAGRLAMPRVDLSVLPGPVGLARLSGVPTLSWPDMVLVGGKLQGRNAGDVFRVRVSDLASGLSPIRPLGVFDFSMALGHQGPMGWTLQSSPDSVLDLQASGPWSIPLTVTGSLACRRFCDYMVGLMAMIGKPEGERYVLQYGS